MNDTEAVTSDVDELAAQLRLVKICVYLGVAGFLASTTGAMLLLDLYPIIFGWFR